MNLVHLTSSTFFGGPERQMLGLARTLADRAETTFISFAEHGRCETFLAEVRKHNFATHALRNDTPHLVAAIRELANALRERGTDVLLCHGYKGILLGRLAARRAGIPALAVSRGWTYESKKVRVYEWLERRTLKFMDRVVCVSEGQADKVRRWCRVPESRLCVIPNSARLEAFARRAPDARDQLTAFFTAYTPERIVLAAGRLSPEKGFAVLVESARDICQKDPGAGVVIFGEGGEREMLTRRLAELKLRDRVVMPGFRNDLDSLIPAADLVTLPSFTEGLPNIALEASAAGVPVVATAVGGCPEVIADGETGLLVPPGNPDALAGSILSLLADSDRRVAFGNAGRRRMHERFTFEAQANAYWNLFHTIGMKPVPAAA
jgi:glycosyltransferase involved in cell wall biosynthesis